MKRDTAKNANTAAPLRHLFDLGDLSQAGSIMDIAANSEERQRLAAWAGVDAVRVFSGRITLNKLSATRFRFEAELAADIVQSCVVTLEPVETHISRRIARELHLLHSGSAARGATGASRKKTGSELTLASGDDDVPEAIESLDYDLAAPLLEEFVLAIDPYPRKEGAEFAPPAGPAEAPENPFGVLKGLKKRD